MGARGAAPGSGVNGGDRGGRRPRSPAASIARARGFAATKPEQLAEWTMEELRQAAQALALAAAVFEDEQARRFEAADVAGQE